MEETFCSSRNGRTQKSFFVDVSFMTFRGRNPGPDGGMQFFVPCFKSGTLETAFLNLINEYFK